MAQVSIKIRPFTAYQTIFINNNGENSEISVKMDEVSKTIKGLKSKYNIEAINLIGNKDYLLQFQKELSTDFDLSKINII